MMRYEQPEGVGRVESPAEGDSDTLVRFKEEFRTLAEVAHPNLASLYDLFAEGDTWYFSTEFVPGQDFLHHVRN